MKALIWKVILTGARGDYRRNQLDGRVEEEISVTAKSYCVQATVQWETWKIDSKYFNNKTGEVSRKRQAETSKKDEDEKRSSKISRDVDGFEWIAEIELSRMNRTRVRLRVFFYFHSIFDFDGHNCEDSSTICSSHSNMEIDWSQDMKSTAEWVSRRRIIVWKLIKNDVLIHH